MLRRMFPKANAQQFRSSASAVWIYFNLIGNTILLPFLVLTFLFSPGVKKRPATLVNLCTCWIFSGIFFLLLYFDGSEDSTSPEPSKALCIAQAALLHGIIPMWSVAVLVMLYHTFLIINTGEVQIGRSKMFLMLIAPYGVQIAFTIATLIISMARPNEVSRRRQYFYCTFHSNPIIIQSLEPEKVVRSIYFRANARDIFTFIICLGIIVLEIRLIHTLFRRWRGLERAGRKIQIDLGQILRILIFGIWVSFGVAVYTVSIFYNQDILPDMYTATTGTIGFLVFGTHSHIFRAWLSWSSGPLSQFSGSDISVSNVSSPMLREVYTRPFSYTNCSVRAPDKVFTGHPLRRIENSEL